jgi:ParB-like chromosome segregation protein Spo0J
MPQDLDTAASSEFALAERSALTPIEEALTYQAKLATGITQTALGTQLGKTQRDIAQKVRLLNLPAAVQAALSDGAISEGHAHQLLRVKVDSTRMRICKEVIAQGLSVAALAQRVAAALEFERRETIIQMGLDRLAELECLLGSQAYPWTPLQFNQWLHAQQHDQVTIDLMTGFYAQRYYCTQRTELSRRLERAQTLPLTNEAEEPLNRPLEHSVGDILTSMVRAMQA